MAGRTSEATGYVLATAFLVASSVFFTATVGASPKPGTPGDPVVLGCGAEAWTPQPVPQTAQAGDLVAGALIIPGGKRLANATPREYGEDGSYKVPFIIKMGATVTVTIGPSAREYVRIDNPYSRVGPVTAITYHACGQTAGFYPQSFVFRDGLTRGCVPLAVRRRGSPARQLVVSLFAGRCPKSG